MSNPDPDVASTPSSPDTDDGDNKRFPFELLPAAVKVPILENIQDIQDKLNVLKVIPQLTVCYDGLGYDAEGYDITGWDDYTSLLFESVYPLVVVYLTWPCQMESCCSSSRWKDVLKLCKVCPEVQRIIKSHREKKTAIWKNLLDLCKVSKEFQRTVTRHFEKYIKVDIGSGNQHFREYRQRQIWITDTDLLMDIITAVSDETSPPWLTTIPFGIALNFRTGDQVEILTKLGTKLWSLQMSLIGAYHLPGVINHLVRCLHLVPNLRRLRLADLYPTQDGESRGPPPVVLRGGQGIVLPELPHLKNITLIGDCPSIQEWILPKYTRQLETLDFYDCYLTENFNPTCFPKLDTVHINRYASIDKVNDLLNKFLLSPLKIITVILDEVDVAKFFNFMLTLNNFGTTLHTLEMKFERMNAEMGDEVRNGLKDWISQLMFPKLSCLHLDCYVGPLEFLLKMPALRKLNIVTSSREPLQCSIVKGLKFSTKKEEMLEPSMWKLFPELEWFQMNIAVDQIAEGSPYVRPYPYPNTLQRNIYVTRECYEKHQKSTMY